MPVYDEITFANRLRMSIDEILHKITLQQNIKHELAVTKPLTNRVIVYSVTGAIQSPQDLIKAHGNTNTEVTVIVDYPNRGD